MAMAFGFNASLEFSEALIDNQLPPAAQVKRRLAFLRRKFKRERPHSRIYPVRTVAVNLRGGNWRYAPFVAVAAATRLAMMASTIFCASSGFSTSAWRAESL